MQTISSHYTSLDSTTLSSFVDSGKEWRNTLGLYRSVILVNKAAVTKYQNLVAEEGEGKKRRTEAIIASTMAEIEQYHEEKKKVLEGALGEMVEGMLKEHEGIVEALKRARDALKKV